ncbi:MAG: SprT family zinc-dependent metalloprotease [Syntrophaceae bacterium]
MNYLLVRSKKRKKTISLHVNTDGSAVVHAPYRTPQGEIDKFFRAKKNWVLRKIRERETRLKEITPKEYRTGEVFLFLGNFHPLIITDTNHASDSLTFSSHQFVLAKDSAHQGRVLFVEWYSKMLQEYVGKRVDYYSRLLGLTPRGIRVSNARCRWGSCSPDNCLSFSWRLIMAPCSVIDYVIVHELMHMRVRNHSVRFWNLVAKIIPDYKQQKLWLKEKGHLLDI